MLRSILKVRKVSEDIREVVTIDDKVILARCIRINSRNIIDIDTVEKLDRDLEIISEQVIDGKKISLVKLSEGVLGLVYEFNNTRELISVKTTIEGELSDDDLINIVITLLRDYSPLFYERLRQILEKYYGLRT